VLVSAGFSDSFAFVLGAALKTAGFSALLAFALGAALGFFRKVFAVQEDPLIGRIRE
jgi:Na+-translocating ferredoxin:NAD+ oxidoreductase RNF subunit RnfB